MADKEKSDCMYEYDYSDKCDCSEDDKCGCTYPNNLSHDVECICSKDEDDEDLLNCNCYDSQEYDVHSIHCDNLIVHNREEDDYSSNKCECGDYCDCNYSLVREYAPNFIATTVMPDNSIDEEFHLSQYLDDSYGLLFFYPGDFAYVCPTEIIALNNHLEEFKSRNVKVIGISVDSKHSHRAWKQTSPSAGGVGNIQFPLVSDIGKEISHDYGILNEDGIALRASFIIDKNGIIRHQTVNDISIGRDVNETLRVIDAIQFMEENGEVCPVGWHKGDKGMTPTPEGMVEYLKKNGSKL